MSRKLYNLYRFTSKVTIRIHRRTSHTGRLVILFTFLAILFGFNTRQTMIYQLASISSMLLLFAFPLSFIQRPKLKIHRLLPRTCTLGEPLYYLLDIKNDSGKTSKEIFFREIPKTDLPTFEECRYPNEDWNEGRNLIDKKLGYYKWKQSQEKKIGISTQPTSLPMLKREEQVKFEVAILPLRRGYIQLNGFVIYQLDPLGLFKKEQFTDQKDKTLVLPKIFPVQMSPIHGSRKYHQGGLSAASNCGDTGEFVSLRGYISGDPVKHIDWKATAKSNDLIVRQYQDEYFSRYGVVLDNFTTQAEAHLLEDAISIAASIILQQDAATNLIDLLFACDTFVSSVSSGRGQATQFHMLEVLACMSNCSNGSFSDLAEQVTNNLNLISGLVIIFVKLDETRRNFLKFLNSNNIIYKALLVTKDIEQSRKQIEKLAVDRVTLFDTDKYPKIVEL